MSKIDKACLTGELKGMRKDLRNAVSPSLVVTKLPLYEYRDIWAEEGGATNANSAQWSFGNGATGFMGLPIAGDGWELVSLYFHADTYAATATIEVALCNYTTPSNAAANVIASIQLANAADGFGATNNAAKFVDLSAAPVVIPNPAILGFRTLQETGNISDARVGGQLRRQVGEYVSDVQLA